MAKCTNCDRDIDRLNGYSQEETRYIVKLDKKGKEINPLFDTHIDSDEYNWITFECPFCMEKVADTAEEALAFLQGGTQEKVEAV
jgi:hypothetical protein